MSKKDKLNALAGIYQREQLEGAVTFLSVDDILPSELQPRVEVKKGIDDLAASLDEDGLLSPLVVTKRGDKYKIIAGERRYHAVKSLGWEEVECKVLDKDDKDSYRLAVIENLQREDLSPFEEVEAMRVMQDKFEYTHAELANAFNKSRSYMTEILSIASLPVDVLNEAKHIGINSKNLLIQLVQAYKNNKVDLFVDAFQNGSVSTVKQAKEFNSKNKKLAVSKKKNSEKNSKINTQEDKAEISRVKLKVNYNEKYIMVKFLDNIDRAMIDRLRDAIEKEFL